MREQVWKNQPALMHVDWLENVVFLPDSIDSGGECVSESGKINQLTKVEWPDSSQSATYRSMPRIRPLGSSGPMSMGCSNTWPPRLPAKSVATIRRYTC